MHELPDEFDDLLPGRHTPTPDEVRRVIKEAMRSLRPRRRDHLAAPILVTPTADGAFLITCPSLPEMAVHVETPFAVVSKATEEIARILASPVERGEAASEAHTEPLQPG
jgi:predicted RNase H-like HicB family nuclease